VTTESDIAIIQDLEVKGQAFLDALEAARPALERLRLAAATGRGTAGVLARLAAHDLDSADVSDPTLEQVVTVTERNHKKN
jgi:hypothetical protein